MAATRTFVLRKMSMLAFITITERFRRGWAVQKILDDPAACPTPATASRKALDPFDKILTKEKFVEATTVINRSGKCGRWQRKNCGSLWW